MASISPRKGYRKITKTIENPHHDGRKRYGMSSVKEYTVGKFIAVRSSQESIAGVSYINVEAELVSRRETLPLEDLPPLGDWTEPGDPPEYDRYVYEFGGPHEWLVQRLFDTGRISFDLVAEIFEEDEEDS